MTTRGRRVPTDPAVPPVLATLTGQDRALRALAAAVPAPVHAYLLVGQAGTGTDEAAIAFAAALVCPDGGCGRCPACRDALAGLHPDVSVVERSGASLLVEDARAAVVLAQRGPVVAKRQVVVVTDVHLVGQAAPVLLKSVEEPPATTVFVLTTEAVTPSLATLASRCVRVGFALLDAPAVEAVLLADGVDPGRAARAAAASGGRLDRARLLARDPGVAERQARWRSVPARLDGTGATAAALATELLASTEELVEVVRRRQADEMEEAVAASKRAGERPVPGRAAMEERHKREQRRVRSDELRAGLAVLAASYRSRLTAEQSSARRLASAAKAVDAVDAASSALARNPNEVLLLEALLVRLDSEGNGGRRH
jgi:DNA polymerase-3 subunit delta'